VLSLSCSGYLQKFALGVVLVLLAVAGAFYAATRVKASLSSPLIAFVLTGLIMLVALWIGRYVLTGLGVDHDSDGLWIIRHDLHATWAAGSRLRPTDRPR